MDYKATLAQHEGITRRAGKLGIMFNAERVYDITSSFECSAIIKSLEEYKELYQYRFASGQNFTGEKYHELDEKLFALKRQIKEKIT